MVNPKNLDWEVQLSLELLLSGGQNIFKQSWSMLQKVLTKFYLNLLPLCLKLFSDSSWISLVTIMISSTQILSYKSFQQNSKFRILSFYYLIICTFYCQSCLAFCTSILFLISSLVSFLFWICEEKFKISMTLNWNLE